MQRLSILKEKSTATHLETPPDYNNLALIFIALAVISVCDNTTLIKLRAEKLSDISKKKSHSQEP